MLGLSKHATELTVIASLFMDACTLIIIYFNLNQMKLNRKSLFVDINFRVFEIRKSLYKHLLALMENISSKKKFTELHHKSNGEYTQLFSVIKGEVENSKHFFADSLTLDLERLILFCEQGVSLEKKSNELLKHDVKTLSLIDQKTLEENSQRIDELVKYVGKFNTKAFSKYLDIMNFDKNLMLDN